MSVTVRTFRVPLGLAPDGSLIGPDEATKAATYACPACGTPLIFRAGQIRARHFAHAVDTGCSPQTVLHATAKRVLVERVALWKAGRRPAPVTIRSCSKCGGETPRPCPESVTGAAEEVTLPSGRRVDVALLADDTVVAAIEVLVTHQVDEVKAGDLGELPWIEVEAFRVLDTPGFWYPVATGGLPPLVCDECRLGKERRWRQLLDLATELGVEIPGRPYWSQPYRCPSCRATTIVTTWPGQTLFRWTSRAPDPRPPWLENDWRFGGYFNRCLRCGEVIPRMALYDYGGPFEDSNYPRQT